MNTRTQRFLLTLILALCLILVGRLAHAQAIYWLDLPNVASSNCGLQLTGFARRLMSSSASSRYAINLPVNIVAILNGYGCPLIGDGYFRCTWPPFVDTDQCRVNAIVNVGGPNGTEAYITFQGCPDHYDCQMRLTGTFRQAYPNRTYGPIVQAFTPAEVELMSFVFDILPATQQRY